jgi:hypothetical protein
MPLKGANPRAPAEKFLHACAAFIAPKQCASRPKFPRRSRRTGKFLL